MGAHTQTEVHVRKDVGPHTQTSWHCKKRNLKLFSWSEGLNNGMGSAELEGHCPPQLQSFHTEQRTL